MAASAALSCIPSDPAHAVAFACLNCSTMVQQLMQYATQAAQRVTQLQQYGTQLQQYANMVRNTTALPMTVWGNAQSDIMQVRSLSNASAILSGNSGGVLARLNSATGYASRVADAASMPGNLLGWQQSINDNVTTLGRTLGLQQGQAQNDALLLAQLQMHAQSASGQMQALQAGNELSAATAGELLKMQAMISASTQYAVQRDLVTADRRATEDAAMARFLGGTSPPLKGYAQW